VPRKIAISRRQGSYDSQLGANDTDVYSSDGSAVMPEGRKLARPTVKLRQLHTAPVTGRSARLNVIEAVLVIHINKCEHKTHDT